MINFNHTYLNPTHIISITPIKKHPDAAGREFYSFEIETTNRATYVSGMFSKLEEAIESRDTVADTINNWYKYNH